MNSRLYRSPDDRVLAGVAGGMAETYGLDPSLVRVGWAVLILFSGGIFLVLYVIMALVVPLRPSGMSIWASGAMGTGGHAEGGPAAEGSAPSGPGMASGGAPGAYPYHRPHRRSDTGGALVIGMILIIVGGFFLARQFIPALNFNLIWPFVIILGGVLLIFVAFIRPSRES